MTDDSKPALEQMEAAAASRRAQLAALGEKAIEKSRDDLVQELERTLEKIEAFLPELREKRNRLKNLTVQMVGAAVLNAQMFETAFAPIYAIHRYNVVTRDPKLEDNIPDPSYKTPLKNYIKQLEEDGRIDPAFAQRIGRYIEARNKLVHQWVRENSYPDEANFNGLADLSEHAQFVALESIALSQLLVKYFLDKADSRVDMREYQRHMQDLFKKVHLLPQPELQQLKFRPPPQTLESLSGD